MFAAPGSDHFKLFGVWTNWILGCWIGLQLMSLVNVVIQSSVTCQQVLDRWTRVAEFRSRAVESSCRQLRRPHQLSTILLPKPQRTKPPDSANVSYLPLPNTPSGFGVHSYNVNMYYTQLCTWSPSWCHCCELFLPRCDAWWHQTPTHSYVLLHV